jgi:hypothetical protein
MQYLTPVELSILHLGVHMYSSVVVSVHFTVELNMKVLISVMMLLFVGASKQDDLIEDDWQWVRYGDVPDDDDDNFEDDDLGNGPFTVVTEDSLLEDDYDDYDSEEELDINLYPKKEL